MNRPKFLALAALLLLGPAAFANIYGAIRGVVHDPQHRPIQNAMVMLKAKSSDWAKSVTTDATGEFQFNAIPLGDYSVSVASQGHLRICAGRSFSFKGRNRERQRHCLRCARGGPDRFRYAHNSRQPPRHRAHSRGVPQQ
jgi:hypothetical protein